MEKSAMSTNEVVEEIMRIHRSLPERPGIEEVEACKKLIMNVEKEDQARIEAISRQIKGRDVPNELFSILLEMQRRLVFYQSNEQKREALKLLDLENVHNVFGELVQRASQCLDTGSSSDMVYVIEEPSPPSTSYSRGFDASLYTSASSSMDSGAMSINKTTMSSGYSDNKGTMKPSEFLSKDDSYLKKSLSFRDGLGKSSLSGDVLMTPRIQDSSLNAAILAGQDGDKLSLIKLASLIEVSSKKGTKELILHNKLLDQVEWIPDSIGKLFSLVTLDLSENRISAIPEAIGGLSSLQKLDLHSNCIRNLPHAIGDLLNLVSLDLSGNPLGIIPSTLLERLVRLEELNVSSTSISALPDTIGSLINLKSLYAETNEIEEILHAIGHCTSLQELRADYNHLKALPEAVGRLGMLEVLSVRYNNIKQLPTTMASMTSLKELNVSFNQLESVPESLCFATNLVKINVSHNFADLQSLPRSIGNLEMLEELDVSNNQIRVLPDSFRMLEKLHTLNLEGNPLEVPPSDVINLGAQAVVQYMADLVARRENPSQPVKPKKSWSHIFFFSKSNKRKRGGVDYIKT